MEKSTQLSDNETRSPEPEEIRAQREETITRAEKSRELSVMFSRGYDRGYVDGTRETMMYFGLAILVGAVVIRFMGFPRVSE